MTPPLADDPARDRISTDLSATLFVNAGAGSGKTKALVDRVVALVLEDDIPMRDIAAVTFTERAGAELRDRLREQLERALHGPAGISRARADTALNDLDSAAIGTLHSFAQRILMQHPIEAGLPPRLEVLDEVGSSVAFDDRWDAMRAALLDDDEVAGPLLTAMALGLKLDHVRSLTQLLTNDWDLLEDRVLRGDQPPYAEPDLSEFLARADEQLAVRDICTDGTDKLLAKLDDLANAVELVAATADGDTRLQLLHGLRVMRFGRVGSKDHWRGDAESVRSLATDLCAAAAAEVDAALEACLRILTRWVATQVLAAAQDRRRAGSLVFHDLLVLARDLLRRDESVRDALHHRYRRILLDEFQDTDPIQIELAVRIAAGAPGGAPRWEDVEAPPGRLFVVGDPKQSIYRFRRASIRTYLDAQDHIGEPVSLTTNFRTVPPVLDWVNTVFGRLIQARDHAQPAYEPLDHHRPPIAGHASVTVLGADAHEDLPRASAALLRAREAADVAAVARRVVDEGWPVFDRGANAERPARLGDIAILIPARTSLNVLEQALVGADVPYRTESSSLVYGADEVRSLLACARAVADTTDALALVQALRSSVFGCGDDDLWRWKQAGGTFSVFSTVDELADDPVGAALAYLKELYFRARWLSPSELLGAVIVDRRMLEVAAGDAGFRDSWRRLRFVVDQARAWSEFSHGGLRAYLAWATRQGQDTARVAEAVLPETDTDAVRIMTVHAAKGLEFPVVILSGLTSRPRNAGGVRLLWTEDGYEVALSSTVQTGAFADAAPIDEQMGELEKYRLLYVAATRARDHLVVSLHRKDGASPGSAAEQLAAAGAVTDEVARFDGRTVRPSAAAPPACDPPPAWEAWLASLVEVRERAARPSSTSASGLEGTEPDVVLAELDPGLAKGARDLELPPWSKGRYGSAIGRAVHGVLQVVDLATGDGLDEAVAAQALAEGVLGQEALVSSLVRSALASDLVRTAARHEHWRETYVGCPQDDGTVLEGYIDLIYRDADARLVVVDYKTDAVPADALGSRVVYYRPQLAAYRAALTAATGASVETRLLFLHPESPATAVQVDTS
jgi:ATP-dependent exoDNAse (exonuclease V) beta subunit